MTPEIAALFDAGLAEVLDELAALEGLVNARCSETEQQLYAAGIAQVRARIHRLQED